MVTMSAMWAILALRRRVGRISEKEGHVETILLVDDEPDVRDLVREILERKGYHILEARDAEEALRAAAAHPDRIHLLLTDVVMPGMNGRELAARLGQQRPAMKVLYMSGFRFALDQHEMAQAGPGLESGSPIIAKPFSAESLTQKVGGLLGAAPPSASPFARRTRPGQPDPWGP
jgi:two-component system cell cycle sensor histidine kinase/response regulator CckA